MVLRMKMVKSVVKCVYKSVGIQNELIATVEKKI